MKKTIWSPLVLGTLMGTLAGMTSVTGLLFIVPGTDSDNAIGIWMTLFLLAAALGGPLASLTAPILLLTIMLLYGSPDMKALLSDPSVYWTNLFVVGMLMLLVSFAYRMIFERVKMPLRLAFWAGIVIAVYLINSPANLILQYYLHEEVGVLPAILGAYRVYLPQAIFDIIITSLVFIALPARYTRPLWYETKPMVLPTEDIA